MILTAAIAAVLLLATLGLAFDVPDIVVLPIVGAIATVVAWLEAR